MADKEQFRREVIEFVEKADTLHYNDRVTYLMALFDKYFTMLEMTHIMPHHEFHKIVSDAKVAYSNCKTPMKITKKEISGPDLGHVAMVQSVIMNLNLIGALRKLVVLDFTSDRL